ncbi:MAG TPA: response regulator transcription factor [Burkholderiales bacterium]|nr:response regulator transcription factor [Burkholderiales bacterium]
MKVLVVDDHALIRTALRGVLGQLDGGLTMLEASDCRSAFDLIEKQPDLDLVLLDLNLPGKNGLAALEELRTRYPALPVVVLSSANDRASVMQALDLGAMGYIPKVSSNEVLVSALRLVLSGGIYIPPEILARSGHAPAATVDIAAAASVQRSAPPRVPADLGLSEREARILRLLLEGKSNKLICRELDIAESTVKNHITQILRALNVTSRTQAVIVAAQMGLVVDRVASPTRPGSS